MIAQNPFLESLSHIRHQIQAVAQPLIIGKVVQAVGTLVKVRMPHLKIGDLCEFKNPDGTFLCQGEVVGFNEDLALVAILGENNGLSTQALVYNHQQSQTIEVSHRLLGRVLDGLGRPCDGLGAIHATGTPYPIYQTPPNPLARQLIHEPFQTGVRAIDGLLTIGVGQRVGIFAGAGVGKSTLLGQLVHGSDCDVRVIALIGERGREVREFLEHTLGPEGLAKSIIVCATSDRSSLERVRAAYTATAIAEYFRDQGQRVMFLMDSVTRFARALREIGLSAGEPPTRGGFPPSVFATLPKLLERSGMGEKGSITAFYTVLVEGNDMTEPVADETRSILDGHIVLSRELASANHFPAIDVLESTSRVSNLVTTREQQQLAGHTKELIATRIKNDLLIKVGEYKTGSDPLVDKAIAKEASIKNFLKQGYQDISPIQETWQQLNALGA